ncbi:MAG: hypothetical protein Q9179_003958 [Wetmoreana sp. 5 TL-2023]
MAETSAINIQQRIILETLRSTDQGEWKVLILDGGSKKLIDGVVREDDILELNVTSLFTTNRVCIFAGAKDGVDIEQIENRRPINKEMDAVYLLSPLPHILDCLMADLERRRYRRTFLIWTSLLRPDLQHRLDQSPMTRQHIVHASVLNIDYYPRESHLITFRDPWSFPTLYHPACDHLVRQHMNDLAQKTHLDQYAKYNHDFPPPSPRPRGLLIITDRTLDLFAPLVHEFTYQAMVHDLLPLVEGDKIYYKSVESQGKDPEISEKDSIWVKYRYLHMKDLLEELVKDFETFKKQNPQFANSIKDMLAGLPKYQEGKEAYSLHLSMTQDAMNVFQERRLADIASVEQSLATGLDEDHKKPKNLADQIVRLLDDEGVQFPDRLRLIIQYLLYRDGLLPPDIQKLLEHARLPAQDSEVIYNLELLGAHTTRILKDSRPVAQYPFGRKETQAPPGNESGLSRFEPALKVILEEYSRGMLDQTVFPFTKPHLDAADGLMGQDNVSQASLRSAKPTWARTRPSANEPRQRIIVFMAGGATYSESRACYEASQSLNKDVYLATTHMLTPSLYLRQVGDLNVDRRRLDLPADRPKSRAPEHLFEKDTPLPPPPPSHKDPKSQPPSDGMQRLRVNDEAVQSRPANGRIQDYRPSTSQSSSSTSGRLTKDRDKEGDKKKKFNFLSSKK